MLRALTVQSPFSVLQCVLVLRLGRRVEGVPFLGGVVIISALDLGPLRVDSSAEAKAWVLELRAAGRRHCPLVATGWNERWLPGDAANFPLKGAGPCCAPGPTCVWARRRLRHAPPLETRRMPSGDRHAGCVGPLHGL